jgi:prevent-host-death family protein
MYEMITVTAAEFQRDFGRHQDEAATQPVTITRNGRGRLVMISAEEYRRLARDARRTPKADELANQEEVQITNGDRDARHGRLEEEYRVGERGVRQRP